MAGLFDVRDRRGLGYLETQLVPGQAVVFDLGHGEFQEFVVADGLPGQVDRHLVGALEQFRLLGPLLAQRADDPAVDMPHQVVAFGGRDEHAGRHQLAVLVLHAHQDLHAPVELFRMDRDDRLRPQAEAPQLQRFADARGLRDLALAQLLLVAARLVHDDLVASLFLGDITGGIGCRERVADIQHGLVQLHDADGHADAEAATAPVEAEVAHQFAQLLGDAPADLQTAVGQQDREFVAAQARQGIGVAQAGPQQAGELAQHLVARGVAAVVVDQLELVQVQVQQHMVGVADPGRQRLLETALELASVDQRGEVVMRGLIGQDLAHALVVGHVLQHRDAADDGAAAGAQRSQAAVDEDALLVVEAQLGQAVHAAGLAVGEGGIDALARGAPVIEFAEGQQVDQRPVEDMLLIAAQQLAGGAVDRVDPALGVGGDHRLLDRLQGDLGELLFPVQRLLGLLLGADVAHYEYAAVLSFALDARHAHGRGKHAAGMVSALQFDFPAGGQLRLVRGIVVEQDVGRFAEDLGVVQRKHLVRGAVQIGDSALRVHGHDGVVDVLDYGARARLAAAMLGGHDRKLAGLLAQQAFASPVLADVLDLNQAEVCAAVHLDRPDHDELLQGRGRGVLFLRSIQGEQLGVQGLRDDRTLLLLYALVDGLAQACRDVLAEDLVQPEVPGIAFPDPAVFRHPVVPEDDPAVRIQQHHTFVQRIQGI